jgi:hypothetical protein
MPLRVGWHLAVWVLPIEITRERRLKPPGPDLPRGASAPIRSYGDAVALASSHPRTVTHTPLRS